jgi:hypothetical protein
MNGSPATDSLGTISRKQGLVVGLLAAAIWLIALAAGDERLGTALALSVLCVSCVAIICWPLRLHSGFYAYVVVVSVMHMAASLMLSDRIVGKI